jgi:toxin-antitoxin system PIN domain toxin
VKLLDVNVWLAAVWRNHEAHARVMRWRSKATEPLALCRVTQMAILRLTTSPAIMGPDAVTRRSAWHLIDALLAHTGVVWLAEPDGLEAVWRALSAADDRSHKLWTDDYLASFAQAIGATFVTLDRASTKRYPSVRVEVLWPPSQLGLEFANSSNRASQTSPD